ncbi:probable choline kinase 1 isoform X2 [Tripterygium wilfordii]|uniref:probable choline kinase 1 isoform X2 n=1 Tax=Tripterygium wilfordii TaxID=458696 RepID=UPI0018F7F170|nr:probable choline kinase 1 isoform X2 [Tripterygium wilfordii]
MIRFLNRYPSPCSVLPQAYKRISTVYAESFLERKGVSCCDSKMGISSNGICEGGFPEELKKVLRTVASNWGDVVDDMEALCVIPLRGAMTNEVYQINWPKKNGDLPRKVLVRLYGEGVEVFFDREDEIRTFECMSKHGQGPRLLGRFADGRVEEFIHAKTLSAADIRDPEISALVASKLREFHNLDMPGPRRMLLWERLRNWLSEAKSLCSLKDAKEFRLDVLAEEIDMLEKEFSLDYQDIGFCHNDLQYGNIMMDEETRAITIIDYEYASYNPIAYDLANHFCEMVANYHSETPHILDYNKYPGKEERRRFVHAYLTSDGNKPTELEAEKLLSDAEKHTLPNHLFWGLWGVISGYVNTLEFDYMEYARQRFEQYWLRKRTLLISSTILPDENVNGSSINTT